MAQQLVNASFEASVRADVTREQVLEALAPLLSYCELDLDDAEPLQPDEDAWFEGAQVGVCVNGLQGADFKQAFDAAADFVAELSIEAFETRLESDAGPTASGHTIRRILGPDQGAIERFRTREAIEHVARLMKAVATPSAAGVGLDPSDNVCGLTAMLVDEQAKGRLLFSISLEGLNAQARADVSRLAHVMASLMQSGLSHEGPRQLFMRDDFKAGEPDYLSDYARALLVLGPGNWTDAEGPSTGVGLEWWFVDEVAGKQAYVCVDQGEITACEINELDAAEQPTQTFGRER
ncbi:MAG TPA: hypothetical protein VN259_07480 [Xanthomonadales bacterium]|nr:hypothetical protein [Xanthomonadales bacterium]